LFPPHFETYWRGFLSDFARASAGITLTGKADDVHSVFPCHRFYAPALNDGYWSFDFGIPEKRFHFGKQQRINKGSRENYPNTIDLCGFCLIQQKNNNWAGHK